MSNVARLFPAPVAAPSRFDELWAIWPRKDGKAIARKKYDAIVAGGFLTKTLDKPSGSYMDMDLSASAEQVIAGAKAYAASQIDRRTYRFKDDGKFIPHLSTWLSRAGWEDFE